MNRVLGLSRLVRAHVRPLMIAMCLPAVSGRQPTGKRGPILNKGIPWVDMRSPIVAVAYRLAAVTTGCIQYPLPPPCLPP